MYYYIYDEIVQEKRFEKELIALENRLADLGITGRVARLALFRNAHELITDELRRGTITTIVAVGDDSTIHKVIDAVSEYDVAFGILPLGEENALATMLGIPEGVEGVDVLSARNIQQIDVGRLNGRRFMTRVQFPEDKGTLSCGDAFTVTSKGFGTIEVFNLPLIDAAIDPTDGILDAVVDVQVRRGVLRRPKQSRSKFEGRHFTVTYPDPVMVLMDGKEVRGKRFEIEVEPKALKIIAGKERVF